MSAPAEPYVPISCALHSELELAAMRRRPLQLQLRNGRSLRGTITDVWTAYGREWLLLAVQSASSRSDYLIDLTQIEGAYAVQS
ncbi:transcriptional antiterminator, Rof [Acidithiobacillus sp. CV18-2]|uniref:Transcriptional antiterminator, Rof n=2 Tax=Igneacidithiobacillus copahuensis TaxID=2724909 RepID=A0AAE2YNT2_9PROT|nr:Rho-binding antiterminator [Igneacidithiobacillus copahuensis]MBU2755797.1 transcriptional antiterminator, Rof [Acidithiobacillus sp. CV18-3]MBU2756288.1 transcriptional antiterminator, Rof [Acidithiobacillus sp. BN09-2]MBU2777795.1 transcriptional antiterminator, Rof [Acidithiobacillus sp. CV18-2]MBU2795979.1 transcriptional antiterminator, Rof [Acidithiobacillus sp. VAN18-2]MBU2800517.1 transcriptional antiterminator, Rof [Acidithiobacillus sp. VAN18-4]